MKLILLMTFSIMFSCQVNKKNIKQIIYAKNFDLFNMKPLDIMSNPADTSKNSQWIAYQSSKDSIILNVVFKYKHFFDEPNEHSVTREKIIFKKEKNYYNLKKTKKDGKDSQNIEYFISNKKYLKIRYTYFRFKKKYTEIYINEYSKNKKYFLMLYCDGDETNLKIPYFDNNFSINSYKERDIQKKESTDYKIDNDLFFWEVFFKPHVFAW